MEPIMLVRDVMTQPVITIPADLACTAAAQLLVGHGFTAAPVVNDDGALIGNPG
jgi:CBS domain-containing protein